jgi:hypothetical protein
MKFLMLKILKKFLVRMIRVLQVLLVMEKRLVVVAEVPVQIKQKKISGKTKSTGFIISLKI